MRLPYPVLQVRPTFGRMREEPDRALDERSATRQDKTAAASAAIDQLVARWVGVIRSAAARYHLAGSDLDELMQDTRIRLWRILEREGPSATVSPGYVYRAAVSAAIDLVRRSRTEQRRHNVTLEVVQDDLPAAATGSDDEEQEILDQLERGLLTVPESRRPAVRLHLSGRHLDEIAQIMGWTRAKTRNLLYRGLTDLRESLTRPERDDI
ncbi:MAG: RNA polymerase sigma factor [Longimicrobiales bacterium]